MRRSAGVPVPAVDLRGGRPLVHLDPTACLTAWLVLLYGISAGIVVPGFGAIGQPATLVALGAFAWWGSARMIPGLGLDQGRQPVRYVLFIHMGYLLGSYALAHTRVLSALQQSGAVRGIIRQVALFGVAALVLDGVHDFGRLRVLLRRLCTFGAIFAAFGIVQAAVGESLLFLPPGLEWNAGVAFDIEMREGATRPLSTGLHPIEYAVIVASLVPLCIHFVLHPKNGGDRLRALVELSLLLLAVPTSLSRTAIVCLGAGLVVLSFGWTWRRRVNALILGVVIVPIVASLVPRAYDIMIELFVGADTSLSLQARIDRIPNIMALIGERPWFGLGFGVFNNTDYFLVDNQLWGLTVELGIVGLVLTLAIFLCAGLQAAWVRYRPGATDEMSHLGRAIAASIAGITVSLATFDAFFYRILSFTLFLLVGCAGALWRIAGEAPLTYPREGATGVSATTPGPRGDGRGTGDS